MNKRKNKFSFFLNPFFISFFLILTYLITHGTFNFYENEPMGIYYTNTLDNLKVGRFDVDYGKVGGWELFFRDGKYYIYYGPFPAFFRGLIELFLVYRGDNDWSRLSCICAAFFSIIFSIGSFLLISTYLNVRKKNKFFYTFLFGLSILMASPLSMLLSSAYLYHEAILWGLAWVSIFIFTFIRLTLFKKITSLNFFILSISCGFALLSRVTFGSILISYFLLLIFIYFIKKNKYNLDKKLHSLFIDKVKKFNTKKTILFGILPIAICLIFALKINYEKWGNPFVFYSYEYYIPAIQDKKRYEIVLKYPTYNLKNLPYSFLYYFIPDKNHFINQFPYIRVIDNPDSFNLLQKYSFFKDVYFDIREKGIPIFIFSFYLVSLAILGMFYFKNIFGIFGLVLLLSFMVQSFFCLIFDSIAIRYTAEFMPLIIIFSICSIKFFNDFEIRLKKKFLILKSLFLMIFFISLYGGIATFLEVKRGLWAVPEEVRLSINHFIEGVRK